MDQHKSATSMTMSSELFPGLAGPQLRPLSAVLRSHRLLLIVCGLMALTLAVVYAAATAWAPSAKPSAQSPLSGSWNCSLAGKSVGVLVVDGWTYVLGSGGVGDQRAGTLERVGVHSKTQEEFLKVHDGALREGFGIRLGFHNAVVEPEQLVFNIGPGSGIHCTRM